MVPVSNEGDGRDVSTGSRPRRRAVPLPFVAVLVAAALVAGYVLGRPGYPLDNSADAGFLRDMSAHHAQAVDMSMTVLETAEDPTLRTVAYDIATTQQSQIGRMQGWLVQWGLGARGAQPPMAWMAGHGHGDAPERMPGLATEEDMDALAAAEGEEAEIQYLELMIEHHQGGAEMADAAASLAREPMVTGFARGMAGAQRSEIELMTRMLEERGVRPGTS
ncbi:DUF305 domain-containing protein [Marinitenerispora sediminis]|uniref:DUF305 domain-containing protein n=1 Tax=Marinitenerispora sediminis TaxID=1931232 RepID=A0A368TBU1_9ACTN|nr:DUF305 domain-containing protein [Marinitenerispora sediminis]RCV54034.1 DUF305 domain-containing protein [Marinitenerispora sediminis]RCV60815.1 DUF305 domain-containing protein [Marinitenerispora sediminis]RCV62446.1 DUF305 domain-containing protein [Marinitenerispora sediminis]